MAPFGLLLPMSYSVVGVLELGARRGIPGAHARQAFLPANPRVEVHREIRVRKNTRLTRESQPEFSAREPVMRKAIARARKAGSARAMRTERCYIMHSSLRMWSLRCRLSPRGVTARRHRVSTARRSRLRGKPGPQSCASPPAQPPRMGGCVHHPLPGIRIRSITAGCAHKLGAV